MTSAKAWKNLGVLFYSFGKLYFSQWPNDRVILTDVDKLSIGFGDKYNPQAGGSGLVFFDDVRLYRPPEP